MNRKAAFDGDEWMTPPEVVQVVRKVLGGIELDPASTFVANQTVGAAQIYTKTNDGLAQNWTTARTIFLNPPYSNPGPFVAKLVDAKLKNPRLRAILLVNNATDTAWFRHAMVEARAVYFPKRIQFVPPVVLEKKHTNRHGQAFLYFGPAADNFLASLFSAFLGFGLKVEV